MTSGDLAGRVALVTGSSAGIGWAIAEALAARGAAIISHGLNPATNAAVVEDWRANGWHCAASAVDLAETDAADRLHDQVCETLGTPDILVLNASIELPQTLVALTAEAVARQLTVNLTTNCLLLQRCLPAMKATGWGRIVAIGSVQEERPNAHHLIYAATKAALTSIVLNLARHDAASGVTFNIIRPGAIETDRNRDRLSDPGFRHAVIDRIPSGRIGTPSDCTGAITLLCSQGGAYINGAVLSIDGGMRL